MEEIATGRQLGGGRCGQVRNLVGPGYRLALVQDDRPAVLPGYGQQERLAANIVEIIGIGPRRQEGRPPVAILRLDQFGVPGRGDGMRTARRQVALRQDRIADGRRKRPAQAALAEVTASSCRSAGPAWWVV